LGATNFQSGTVQLVTPAPFRSLSVLAASGSGHGNGVLAIQFTDGSSLTNLTDKYYKVGDLVSGKVTKLASFGAFIGLQHDIDGLVHISQVSEDRVDKINNVLKVNQDVTARVIKIDKGERRIGLSIKAANYSRRAAGILACRSGRPARGSMLEEKLICRYALPMRELVFEVIQEADGGFCAECLSDTIVTEGDTWEELRKNVQEVVRAFYFDRPEKIPSTIRLHLVRDEVLAVA
jgi:predicted RNA-binding protein with RPS1 domain